MRLVKFTVEKYRSILSKSELPIGDYTAILGPNNQGKSNLLRGLSVALRVVQRILDYSPYHFRRNVRRVFPYRHMMRELYDWDTDYPIQRQHDKRTKDDRRRLSKFLLDFKLEQHDIHELQRWANIKLINDTISVKLELGRGIYRLSMIGQKSRVSQTEKAAIIDYLVRNINICYIDAERSAETAQHNISELIELPIRKQFESNTYKEFVEKVRVQQENVLSEISTTLRKSLKVFLPSIKSSKIQVDSPSFRMSSPSTMSSDIFINDGVETPLRQKGSGVQSLIAISIAHYISQSKKRGSGNLILAIEEPETHLHPKAIHQVKDTLQKISQKTPVIITTHSPLLVNLKNVESNIIVKDNEASPAKIIRDIREALGVQRYDNLTNAECAILVEGLSDERILEAVLGEISPKIATSLTEGRLCICNAQGCSRMNSIIATLRMDLCEFHIVLDHDKAANSTYENLTKQCNVDSSDITIMNVCLGNLSESELEDTIDTATYKNAVNSKYSLPDESVLPKRLRTKKWSERMQYLYNTSGKVWSQEIEDNFKTIVANEVVKNPKGAIRKECMPLYMSLAKRIEKMLEK